MRVLAWQPHPVGPHRRAAPPRATPHDRAVSGAYPPPRAAPLRGDRAERVHAAEETGADAGGGFEAGGCTECFGKRPCRAGWRQRERARLAARAGRLERRRRAV